jgi:hypothetical protein
LLEKEFEYLSVSNVFKRDPLLPSRVSEVSSAN